MIDTEAYVNGKEEALPLPVEGPPKAAPETYRLTDAEHAAISRAAALETALKLQIYDAQTRIEALQRELIGAVAQSRGARAMLVQTRGWENATLSDDLRILTRKEPDGLDLPK